MKGRSPQLNEYDVCLCLFQPALETWEGLFEREIARAQELLFSAQHKQMQYTIADNSVLEFSHVQTLLFLLSFPLYVLI